MKKIGSVYYQIAFYIILSSAILLSCNKKDLYVEAAYPDQKIGISQAAIATLGPGANGVYKVSPNLVGRESKFIINAPGNKLNISMGIIRSGINSSGAVVANLVTANSDTITKLSATGLIMPTTTEILPASAYSFPSTVTVEDGSSTGEFMLEIDLNFLIANITKKYAVAIGLSSAKSEIVNPKLSVAVIYIDPTIILLPKAVFGTAVDAGTKTVEFLNSSENGVTYSWNFGDGSAIDNTLFPKHKYATSGTYSVTLTVTGVTGAPSVRTTNVTIL